MKKFRALFSIAALLVLVLIALTGCDLFGVKPVISIQNYSGETIWRVEYRESGSATWTEVYFYDYEGTRLYSINSSSSGLIVLDGKGTYDFRFYGTVTNEGWELGGGIYENVEILEGVSNWNYDNYDYAIKIYADSFEIVNLWD